MPNNKVQETFLLAAEYLKNGYEGMPCETMANAIVHAMYELKLSGGCRDLVTGTLRAWTVNTFDVASVSKSPLELCRAFADDAARYRPPLLRRRRYGH